MSSSQTTLDATTRRKPTAKDKMSRPGTWVAIGAVVFWALSVGVLWHNAGTQDADKWMHLTFVFASVQAIASAAAGALFGNAVQQDRVKSAETRATNAESAANNGRALALIMQSEAEPSNSGEHFESLQSSDSPAGDAVLQRHAALARSLFGDVLNYGTQPPADPTTSTPFV
jgi:hypothetical protein